MTIFGFIKRLVYWILFLPLAIIMIILSIIWELSELYDEILYKYENWTFDWVDWRDRKKD